MPLANDSGDVRVLLGRVLSESEDAGTEMDVPSQKIDELFGASFGCDHVREHKGLQDLMCNCFATAHVGTSIEC